MLSYGLRLAAAVIPFVLPLLFAVSAFQFAKGDHAAGTWLLVMAVGEIIAYGIHRGWARRREEDAAREWQRLNRDGENDAL